jgi:drug/metabolite transporter (DMT)-like permease
MGSLGSLLALLSGLVWGAADFVGGVATRRGHQFQVVAISAAAGIILLLACALLFRERIPPPATVAWAAVSGVAGAIGLASLYRGLSLGSAATVAPTAAVITAVLPVVFHDIQSGWPPAAKLAGFAVALAGIWLVAAASGPTVTAAAVPRRGPRFGPGLRLAILAGIGFGSFLILIAQVEPDLLFVPLAIARAVMLVTGLMLMRSQRLPLPSVTAHPLAVLAGVLDAAGNVLYLLARDLTRMDVAAVLASLYPVSTVVLARLLLKEQITVTQWIGAAVCLMAIVLITL